MLTLAAATLVVLVGAVALAARLDLPRRADRLLAVAVFLPAFAALALLVAAFALGALTAARALVAAVALAAPAVAVAGRARIAALARDLRIGSAPAPSAFLIGALALAALAAAWRAYAALVLPPYAYDGLTYHLTTVATWIGQRDLEPTPLSLCCSRYPATGELLFAWPALFTGTDTGVDAVQLVLAIVASAATGGIALALGASRQGALAAACLFFLTPVVLAQTTTNYVDVISAAGILVALYFVVRFLQAEPFGGHPGAPRAALLVPAGAGAGLALGTKVTGVVALAVLLALVSARIARACRLAARVAALLVPALLVGSFWYVRNLVDTGNPVHPVEVAPLGIVVFDGPVELDDLLTVPVGAEGRPWPVQIALSWARDLAPWISADEGYSYEQRLGGLGPLWIYLGAPLLVLLAARAVAARRWSSELDFLAPVAFLFVLQPYQWWSRFTLFLAAAGCVAIVLTLERTRRRLRAALASATVVLAALGSWYANAWINPAGGGSVLAGSELFGLADEPGGERTIGRLFFDEYRWVDDVPPAATVGVELGEDVRFVYPLFGASFDRSVVRLIGDGRREFLAGLRRDGVEYALVARGGRFDTWLSRFRVVHDDGSSRAYRLSGGRGP